MIRHDHEGMKQILLSVEVIQTMPQTRSHIL